MYENIKGDKDTIRKIWEELLSPHKIEEMGLRDYVEVVVTEMLFKMFIKEGIIESGSIIKRFEELLKKKVKDAKTINDIYPLLHAVAQHPKGELSEKIYKMIHGEKLPEGFWDGFEPMLDTIYEEVKEKIKRNPGKLRRLFELSIKEFIKKVVLPIYFARKLVVVKGDEISTNEEFIKNVEKRSMEYISDKKKIKVMAEIGGKRRELKLHAFEVG